jgi:hypothetical protein
MGNVNGPPETGGPFVEVRLRAVWLGVSRGPGCQPPSWGQPRPGPAGWPRKSWDTISWVTASWPM